MAEKNRMLDLQNDGLESIQPDRFWYTNEAYKKIDTNRAHHKKFT